MAFDFSAVSVAVADSNPFMRRVIGEVLAALGFGNIHVLADGLRAIEFLEPERAGAPAPGTVDLILADLHLESLDGVMLARWLRRHENSPDRFMPVIMLGVAELHDVALARDAGVTDLVAGEFSVDGLGRRLAATVVEPRRFVCTRTFFGPDRRRRPCPRPAGERREAGDDAEAVVETGKLPTYLSADGPPVKYYQPHNRLKEKACGGPDREDDHIAPAMLAAARRRVAEMSVEFAERAAESVRELDGLCDAAADISRAAAPMRRIHRIARDLRGQGGLFDYPLIAEFGESLCEVANAETPPSPAQVALVRTHMECIAVAAGEDCRGDAGPLALELHDKLERAKRTYAIQAAL